MCGLAGIFDGYGERPISERLLIAMRDRLLHRGPDGCGIHIAPGVGLAHRRLAIVDLAGGHQPLYNEDGQVVVVFNGEIYNFPELVRELKGRGHTFQTHSDTEVIVHGWEEWGPDCVGRFHGMFAFALWDAGKQTLFLARDRLGKKPLYYTTLDDGRLLFASELKALVACPQTKLDIDPQAVEDYLAFGYVPEPRSIYRGVHKLPAAHHMIWQRGRQPRIDSYWAFQMTEEESADTDDLAADLRVRLGSAVAKRLMADVPLGAFLSGGVDSSGIVSLMAEMSQQPVNTFSIFFNAPNFDESAYAEAIAQRYRTNHRKLRVDPDDLGLIDRLAGMFDEPFGDCSAMPTYRVCALARQSVTVALSGDGGDEIFAGYRRYQWHKKEECIRQLMPMAIRRPVFAALGAAYPKLDWAPRWMRAKTTFEELSLDPVEAYANNVSVIPTSLREKLYTPWMRRELQSYRAIEVLRRHMAQSGTDHPVLQAQYADIKTWLPGNILVKVDRTSMATSLEVRSPLLDHQLLEWGCRLPAARKIYRGHGKYVLKRALEPLVPHRLLYRAKQGFSSPLDAWFRGPLSTRMDAAASTLNGSGYLDGGVVRRLIDQHRSGRRNHGPVLWSLLMFDAFLRHDAGLRIPATSEAPSSGRVVSEATPTANRRASLGRS